MGAGFPSIDKTVSVNSANSVLLSISIQQFLVQLFVEQTGIESFIISIVNSIGFCFFKRFLKP